MGIYYHQDERLPEFTRQIETAFMVVGGEALLDGFISALPGTIPAAVADIIRREFAPIAIMPPGERATRRILKSIETASPETFDNAFRRELVTSLVAYCRQALVQVGPAILSLGQTDHPIPNDIGDTHDPPDLIDPNFPDGRDTKQAIPKLN